MNKLISAGLIGAIALTVGVQAHAKAPSQGAALTMCKSEISSEYGEDARTKFKKFMSKKGAAHRLSLRISGVEEKAFNVTCTVNREGDEYAASLAR